MAIDTKYSRALMQYQDSIPVLQPGNSIPQSVLIMSCNKHIPMTHRIYEQCIQENQPPCARLLNNIKLIERIVSFEEAYKPSLPALLDPPLKGEISYLSPLLKALHLDKSDKINIRNKTNFFFVRELPTSSLPSESSITTAKALLNAHDILKYPLSQTNIPIPQTTKKVALGVLSGEKNPFDKLNYVRNLGHGAYAEVLLVQTQAREHYAVKIAYGPPSSASFNDEYCHLGLMSHKHIVKLLHVDIAHHALFLEYVEKGPLTTRLSTEKILPALTQIASTLSDIHSCARPLIHSDLKLTNILMDKDDNIKLVDFGLSFFKDKYEPLLWDSIPYYLPPELLKGTLQKDECEKIDVWSFGILIWEFLKKSELISPVNNPNHLTSPPRNWDISFTGFIKGELKNQLNPDKVTILDPTGWLVHAMVSCLDITPSNRPNMNELTDLLTSLRLA